MVELSRLCLQNTWRLTKFTCAHYGINLLGNETVICSIIVAKADDTFYHMIYLRKPNNVTAFTKYFRHGNTCYIAYK